MQACAMAAIVQPRSRRNCESHVLLGRGQVGWELVVLDDLEKARIERGSDGLVQLDLGEAASDLETGLDLVAQAVELV